ncbi:MAG: M23 family metallopeptidase, partial [Elusimicrobiota bacterium]|nr:M23 family metallopeptidase [Elusimicrobiota bacterium]
MKTKLNHFSNKNYSDKFTIMFFSNINSSPKTISISKKGLYICFSILFFIIISSLFIITRYINYINVITNNLVLENKLEHFSKELVKNRNYLVELQNIDANLREVLNMKDSRKTADPTSIGGPHLIDQIIAKKLENGNGNILFTFEEFDLTFKIMKQEIENQILSYKEILFYINIQNKIQNAKPSIWPTIGGYVTSSYGYRIHPIRRRSYFHKGIDIANSYGKPILATADGVVKYANWLGGYGKMVIINHGYGYTTFYAHMSKILVKNGTKVKRGDKIGLIGNTG